MRTAIDAARLPPIGGGLIGLAGGGAAGLLIGGIASRFGGAPEVYMPAVAATVGLTLALGAGALVLGGVRDPGRIGIGVLAITAAWLCGMLAYRLAPQVMFRADIHLWSESAFLHDLLKLDAGYPLYTTELNNESFIYTPGAQLLTYLIAKPLGLLGSVPFLRMVQVGFVVITAIVAFLACRALVRHASSLDEGVASAWSYVWVPAFLLLAMNPHTNPFTFAIHNDALANLTSVLAFLLLCRIAEQPTTARIALLAVLPGLGFFVKQSVAIWAILGTAYLLFFAPGRSLKRAFLFAVGAFGGIGALTLLGLLLWGEPFWYWVFVVPGTRGVSLLRSIQHALDAWPFIVAGLVGGALVLRGTPLDRRRAVFGLWLVWLVFMGTEAYTSGIGWTLHHMGPGSVIGAIWFFAGVAQWWDRGRAEGGDALEAWVRYGIQTAVVVLVFNGLGMIQLPISVMHPDYDRYVREIEREFEGVDPERTLLDVGTWVYLPSGVIAKDRLVSIGDRGLAASGDFSGMIGRLNQKYYTKMLVRRIDSPVFWYDQELWPERSGIQRALLDNYEVVGRIRAVADEPGYEFSDVFIMVPRRDEVAGETPPAT